MKAVFSYFMPIKKISHFEELKSKFLISSVLMGMVLITFVISKAIFFPDRNFLVTLVSSGSMGFILVACLFILRYKSFTMAGNMLSIVSVAVVSVSIMIIQHDIPIMFKLINGYYTVLGLLVLNAIFATRKILIFNTFVIFVASTRVYIYSLSHPDQYQIFVQSAYFQHLIILIIISVTVYFANLFTESVLDRAITNAKTNEEKNRQLNTLFDIISETSAQLRELTQNLTDTSVNLTTEASEHAASVEEISASLEELGLSVATNADYTSSTANLIRRTSDFSTQSKEAMVHTLESIKLVNTKIELIQEIAIRTNILSINAAIEAAHAGASGKGFGVVAKEVRKLAERSGLGSREIFKLISDSLKISETAWGNYQEIASDIAKINAAIHQIATINTEQRINVEQINDAIGQISQSSLSNAALASMLDEAVHKVTGHLENLENVIHQRNLS